VLVITGALVLGVQTKLKKEILSLVAVTVIGKAFMRVALTITVETARP